jgi:peptidyl-prolyl cis-trans isomerase A (cyclophilin A)
MRLATRGFIAVLALLCAAAICDTADQAGKKTKSTREKLMNPALLKEKAPDVFQAQFDTSKGVFAIEVVRAWAPNGADRFYNLVKNGYYNNCRFFRVLTGAIAQFGINGDPQINTVWRQSRIQDDPVVESNKRGYVSFAKATEPNSRTTQVFINYRDNSQLDATGFAPFGKVVVGIDVVESLYYEYGEGAPKGNGPVQSRIQLEGNAYLAKEFPKLDLIKSATIVKAPPAGK